MEEHKERKRMEQETEEQEIKESEKIEQLTNEISVLKFKLNNLSIRQENLEKILGSSMNSRIVGFVSKVHTCMEYEEHLQRLITKLRKLEGKLPAEKKYYEFIEQDLYYRDWIKEEIRGIEREIRDIRNDVEEIKEEKN